MGKMGKLCFKNLVKNLITIKTIIKKLAKLTDRKNVLTKLGYSQNFFEQTKKQLVMQDHL